GFAAALSHLVARRPRSRASVPLTPCTFPPLRGFTHNGVIGPKTLSSLVEAWLPMTIEAASRSKVPRLYTPPPTPWPSLPPAPASPPSAWFPTIVLVRTVVVAPVSLKRPPPSPFPPLPPGAAAPPSAAFAATTQERSVKLAWLDCPATALKQAPPSPSPPLLPAPPAPPAPPTPPSASFRIRRLLLMV